jgi:hypothetical protein
MCFLEALKLKLVMLIIKYGPFGVAEFVILFGVFVILRLRVGVLVLSEADVLCFVLYYISCNSSEDKFLKNVCIASVHDQRGNVN